MKHIVELINAGVVIVGGGYTGITCAQKLESLLKDGDQVRITVIEKRNFLYHCVGSLRGLLDEEFVKNLFISNDRALKKGFSKMMIGTVTKIEAHAVHVEQEMSRDEKENIELNFDYLIIATGSTCPLPGKPNNEMNSRAEITQELTTYREKLANSSRVLIIGGGAVGCELAGEIAHYFNGEKSVTLVDSNARLFSKQNLNEKFCNKVLTSMEKLKVKVLFNEKVLSLENWTTPTFEAQQVSLSSGKTLQVDAIFPCIGQTPNGNLMETLNSKLIKNLAVAVRDTLQLDHDDYAHIFCIGDANNHATPKMAYTGGAQAEALAASLVAHIRHQKPIPAYTFDATPACILPLGPNGGVTQFPFFGGVVTGDFATKWIKSRDLFSSKFFAQLNATPQ